MRQIILCSSRCASLVVGVMYPSSVGIVELRISLGLTGVRTRERGGAARSVPWGSGGRALEGLDAPPARPPHCELPVPHHPRGRNASEPARRGPQGGRGGSHRDETLEGRASDPLVGLDTPPEAATRPPVLQAARPSIDSCSWRDSTPHRHGCHIASYLLPHHPQGRNASEPARRGPQGGSRGQPPGRNARRPSE